MLDIPFSVRAFFPLAMPETRRIAPASIAVVALASVSLFAQETLWRPVAADGIVGHGQEVTLGGVTLVAHMTPGHTKGNTTWTMMVDEGGRKYNVVFVGSMGLNRARLVNNAKYPEMVDDYAKAFEVLKKLPCDVFLAFHADHFGLVAKKRRLNARTSPNPFIDGPGFRAYLEKNEALFRAQLEKERTGR